MVEPRKSIIDETSVRPFVSPQQKKQRRMTIVIVLLVVAMAAGAYFLLSPKEETYTLRSYDTAPVRSGRLEMTTQASGTIAIPAQMEVRSPEAGYADELYVIEGDPVTDGTVLAEIDVPDLEESLSDLADEYEIDLLNLERSNVQNAISLSRTRREIAALEKDVAEARDEVGRLERLVAVDSARQSDLEAAREQLEGLNQQLEEKQIDLSDDLRLIEIDTRIRQADIDRTLREIGRLEERISSGRITAPMTGEVLEVNTKLGVPGSEISANESLFVVADSSSAVADLELLEQYAATVEIGDTVLLTVSNTEMTGKVVRIGRVAQTSSDGLGATIAVRVEPIDPPIALLSGATTVGTFVVGVAEDTMTLPRGPYLTTGSQRYVFVVDGDVARKTHVTFGQIEGDTIEVINGLSPGDEIITSGYQNFIEHETVKLVPEGA